MSSELDPAKLKVVDLRAELTNRGLDAKGNKAVLVKRLKDALKKELQQDVPDTSIADTSTEDCDVSHSEESEGKVEKTDTEKIAEPEPPAEGSKEVDKTPDKMETKTVIAKGQSKKVEKPTEKPKVQEKTIQESVKQQEPVKQEPVKQQETVKQQELVKQQEPVKQQDPVKQPETIKQQEPIKQDTPTSKEQKCENGENTDETPQEPPAKKSRWGSSTENVDGEGVEKKDVVEQDVEMKDPERGGEKEDAEQKDGTDSSEKKEGKVSSESGNEPRGDKRKRSSPSPTRSQRRRSRSPIKEDEPVIDNNKVQLNWYDSDLHLQVDKESFLSARPFIDGAFGYVWAGVRATHGAGSGKVAFEVKIIEELKWEDLVKSDRSRRDRERRDSKRDRSDRDDDKKKEKSKKKSSQEKSSNKDDKKVDGDGKNKKQESEGKENKKDVEEKEIKKGAEVPKDADGGKEQKKDVSEEGKVGTLESTDIKQEPIQIEDIKQETMEMKDIKQEPIEMDDVKQEPIEMDDVKQEPISKDDIKPVKMENEEDSEIVKPVEQVQEKESSEGSDNKDVTIMETEVTTGEATREEKEGSMEVDENSKGEIKEKEVHIPTHLIRVGWSTAASNLQLGESEFSYGYESSGNFVVDKQFSQYGKKFSVGSVIGAYASFDDDFITLTYTVDGEELPAAITIPRSELPEGDFVLFPHILARNLVFEVNTGNREEPWFGHPESLADYVYISQAENKVLGPMRPEKRSDCEVIMMCGLPASGKTHWVREYIEQNPEKRYTVIGNSELFDKMTVEGSPLRKILKGSRWNLVIDKLSKCLNRLTEVAALRRRNYILDQTNVFPSAQRRKMRSFEGFKRRAVIVVCGEEEQAKRQALQEAQDGKDVPDVVVSEMKANMSIPRVGDWLDEVSYVELKEQESKAMVQKYNEQGKEAGFGPTMTRRHTTGERYNKWHNRRNDYRGNYRDRSYNVRYERGYKYSGSWHSRPSGGGGGGGSYNRNEHRDNRGSSGRTRDFRSNNRGVVSRYQERGRDRDSSRHSSRDTYSRNRNQGSKGGNWQSGGGNWSQSHWGSQSNWQGQGSGGGSNWSGQGSWSQGQGQGKWNYNQGYGQQNYGNYPTYYYGQYPNWNAQGQVQQGQAAIAASNANTGGNAQAWAQYAQQYAQSNTSQQSTGHK